MPVMMPKLLSQCNTIIYGGGASHDYLPVLRNRCGAVTVATHFDHLGFNLYLTPDMIRSFVSVIRSFAETGGPSS